RLDDLDADLIPLLRGLPFVVRVGASGSTTPTRRIVHLLDWHYVPRDQFAAELRTHQPGLPDAGIDREHERLLLDVAALQRAQEAALRRLTKDHGLEKVRVEGLSQEGMEELPLRLALLGAAIGSDSRECRWFRLESGAACVLAAEGLLDVLPLEDEQALEQAN